MFKITAILSLLLIGSTLWAANLSCDSCGSECISACGTRHFRHCCFNYLRRKRGQDNFRLWSQSLHDAMLARSHGLKSPSSLPEDSAEPWNLLSDDYKPYLLDENFENRMQPYDV